MVQMIRVHCVPHTRSKFESLQCLYMYKYVDQIDSAARLSVKTSAGVAPEVILRKSGLLKSMCQYTQRVSVLFQMANSHTRMCTFLGKLEYCQHGQSFASDINTC